MDSMARIAGNTTALNPLGRVHPLENDFRNLIKPFFQCESSKTRTDRFFSSRCSGSAELSSTEKLKSAR